MRIIYHLIWQWSDIWDDMHVGVLVGYRVGHIPNIGSPVLYYSYRLSENDMTESKLRWCLWKTTQDVIKKAPEAKKHIIDLKTPDAFAAFNVRWAKIVPKDIL
jgi:hypothetical protein